MEGFELPPRKKLSEFLNQAPASKSGREKNFFAKAESRTPRKGKCWTEEEHLAFLAGLTKLGKGNWTGIARYYVPTRTSTQIASHAQKYLQRMTGATKRKSRFSDIEQQVQMSGIEEVQPVGPVPELPLAGRSARSAPPGITVCWEGSGGVEESGSPAAKQQRVRRPMAIKATSSEPDLLKLAESLICLSDPSRSFSASDKSAFKRTDSIVAQ